MNNQYLSNAQADAINNESPCNQNNLIGSKLQMALWGMNVPKTRWYVDGTNGIDTNDGLSWNTAFKTIQQAINSASAFDTIIVIPKAMPVGATDPVNYDENLIIPATLEGLSIIGYNTGRTQGGLPQIKKGSGTSAQITVRAPGCLIANLGINGAGATGGGILLDDNGTTKTAFGTSIIGCHFKNCVGTTATDARTGGAIQWAATGGAWQVLIQGNRFYKNVGDIVLLGTSASIPQDVVIDRNVFSGPEASVDCNIYIAAGSGMVDAVISNNIFPAFPAIGSGSVIRFIDATNCVGGILCNNVFGDTVTATGYGAARAKAKIPATMFITNNYNESGLIARQ